MGSNYQRGRRFEWRVRDILKAERGAILVVRAASSKGIADLVALYEGGNVDLVQCKASGRISRAERRELIEVATIVHAVPLIAYKDGDGKVIIEHAGGGMDES